MTVYFVVRFRVVSSYVYKRIFWVWRHSQVVKAMVCKTVIPGSTPGAASIKLPVALKTTDTLHNAGVAKLVDAKDLKSFERKFVPVRVRPPAPRFNFLGGVVQKLVVVYVTSCKRS